MALSLGSCDSSVGEYSTRSGSVSSGGTCSTGSDYFVLSERRPSFLYLNNFRQIRTILCAIDAFEQLTPIKEEIENEETSASMKGHSMENKSTNSIGIHSARSSLCCCFSWMNFNKNSLKNK